MKMRRIDNRRDILLLFLYSRGLARKINEPVQGKTRLMKAMFLFREEALPHFQRGTAITPDNFYEFFPWDFGPFSVQVYDDLNFFILRDFVATAPSKEESIPETSAEWEHWLEELGDTQSSNLWHAYDDCAFYLTKNGVDFAATLYAQLSEAQKSLLESFKTRICAAPLRAILRYVYSNYEKMTAKSRIKDSVQIR